MLKELWSGGQTGTDRTAWNVAKAFGIPTGGIMCRGFYAEDGRHPEFRELYGAVEIEATDYPARTIANVKATDGTAIFTNDIRSPGTLCAANACKRWGKPALTITPVGVWNKPESLAKWIRQHEIKILNVGGNRRSSFPYVEEWVTNYLSEALTLLGHSRIGVEAVG